MKHLHTISLAALIAAMVVVACEDDPAAPPPTPPVAYENLTEREDVLHNLQQAYNGRRLDRLDELLDAGFTFQLAPSDVGGGLPAQWGRAEEVAIHTSLFDSNYAGPAPKCTDIFLDVEFEDGVTWVPVPGLVTGEPSVAEEWFMASVDYNFQFDVVPDTHLESSPGSSAQFFVRNAGTTEAPHWQLAGMRDLGSDSSSLNGSSNAVVPSTWGKVKGLYYP